MAKLKNSFTAQSDRKSPVAGLGSLSSASQSKAARPRDLSARLLTPAGSGSVSHALKFGTMHTKASGASSSSGSPWTSLLNAASGGVSGILGGGLFSSGGFGFVSKLLSLFGGGHSLPAAPVAFQSPLPQQNSLNITTPGSASSIALGVHSITPSGQGAGMYQQTGSNVSDHAVQSDQVVQIVRQALLTSSSLNDVIAEI